MASTTTPHYLRVARALALVTGLAGLPACSGAHSADAGPGGNDAGPGGTDAGPGGMDAGPPGVDAGPPTGTDAGPPTGTDAGPPTGTDAGPGGTDAGGLDAGGDICSTCHCAFIPTDAGGLPTCDSIGVGIQCCAAIGPLPPPNVPAA